MSLCEIPNCKTHHEHVSAWADAGVILWLYLCDRHYRALLEYRNRIDTHIEEQESCATN